MENSTQLRQHKRDLLKRMTSAEKQFEKLLKECGIEYKKQMILGFFILDFCVPSKMINIEIDGEYHDLQKKKDELRDKFIKKCGFKVIRIKNKDVENIDILKILKRKDFDLKKFRSALAKANSLRSSVIVRNKRLSI